MKSISLVCPKCKFSKNIYSSQESIHRDEKLCELCGEVMNVSGDSKDALYQWYLQVGEWIHTYSNDTVWDMIENLDNTRDRIRARYYFFALGGTVRRKNIDIKTDEWTEIP